MAWPSASVLSVVTSQTRSSPTTGSLGLMATTGAVGGVFDTVSVLLVAVVVSVPSSAVTMTYTSSSLSKYVTPLRVLSSPSWTLNPSTYQS